MGLGLSGFRFPSALRFSFVSWFDLLQGGGFTRRFDLKLCSGLCDRISGFDILARSWVLNSSLI